MILVWRIQLLALSCLAYSYCNYKTIEEEVYPTGWDYDKLYDAMQWMSDDMIAKCTPEILGKRLLLCDDLSKGCDWVRNRFEWLFAIICILCACVFTSVL